MAKKLEVPRFCEALRCTEPHRAQGYCKLHYNRMRRAGVIDALPKLSREEKIWARVDKSGPEGCWIWTGALDKHGYGEFSENRRRRRAHRVVYELVRGEIPPGLVMDHLCRVKSCVNPEHLDPVTHTENVRRGLISYNLRTKCRNGLHDITNPGNIYVNTDGKRSCRICINHNARMKYRKRKGLDLEDNRYVRTGL